MANLKTSLEQEIQLALKFCGLVKILKIALGALVVISYFFFPNWLIEVVVVSVVISLILPLGFFDVFIQKLLEYNTQTLEERQILNAKEANQHFESLFKKLGR